MSEKQTIEAGNSLPPPAGWMSEADEGSLNYPVGQSDMVRDDRLVYECRACSNDLHEYHCRTEMPPDMTPVRCLFYDAAGQHPDWYRVDWCGPRAGREPPRA